LTRHAIVTSKPTLLSVADILCLTFSCDLRGFTYTGDCFHDVSRYVILVLGSSFF